MHYSPGQKGEDIAEVIILSLILNSDRSGTEKLRKASLLNLFQSPFISNALPETSNRFCHLLTFVDAMRFCFISSIVQVNQMAEHGIGFGFAVLPLSLWLRYQAKLGLPFKVMLKFSKVMPKGWMAGEEEIGYPSIIALEASVSGQVQN